jgi:hypothetical protein
MGKQQSIKDEPKPAAAGEDAGTCTVTSSEVTPKMALAEVDAVRVESLIKELKAQSTPIEQRQSAEPTDMTNSAVEIASTEAPHIAPDDAWSSTAEEEMVPAEQEAATEASQEGAPPRVSRFTMLAACLALAAAFGGMIGALAAYGFTRPQPAPEITIAGSDEIAALKENLIQARVDLAALKTIIEAGSRSANSQFTKITERIERIERIGAEPAARLTKAAENLERISRADFTGGIAPPQPAGSAAKLEGWVLRDVRQGTALLEGRAGVFEVEQGDVIPGIGRIEAIRKQDGRWVVVTSKGSIVGAK